MEEGQAAGRRGGHHRLCVKHCGSFIYIISLKPHTSGKAAGSLQPTDADLEA